VADRQFVEFIQMVFTIDHLPAARVREDKMETEPPRRVSFTWVQERSGPHKLA
jgi:hypothetical protein